MHATKTGGMIFCGMNEAYVRAAKKQKVRFVINGEELDCEKWQTHSKGKTLRCGNVKVNLKKSQTQQSVEQSTTKTE